MLKVQTVLSATDMVFGFRYFLHTFFYTFALISVSTLTVINSFLALLIIYVFTNSSCYPIKLSSSLFCCCRGGRRNMSETNGPSVSVEVVEQAVRPPDQEPE